MFKLLYALALFAVVLAQAPAQAAATEVTRAPGALPDQRGAPTAAAGATPPPDLSRAGAVCGAAGQAACVKPPQDAAAGRPVPVGEPGGLNLLWAALGVVAFVALRRRPQP